MDYFLKAADEAELRAALIVAGIVIVAEGGEHLADGCCLDVIGTIFRPTGGTLAVDGVEVPEMTPIDGYHANLRGVLSDTQLAILAPILLGTPPANPTRVWA